MTNTQPMVSAAWSLVPGTLDYVTPDGWRAVYRSTHRSGFALYWTFAPGVTSRKQRDAFAVGGLPARVPAELGG